jgi:peptidoglycan hydrolase-like protein with peptidoglycan-binding domain
MGPEMADHQNEKPPVVRQPESGIEVAREAGERLRVAEIAREIEVLGRALDERDRLPKIGTAKRAESRPAQAGQPARGIADRSTPKEPFPTVADMSSASKMVSFQIGRFATTPAIPEQRKLIADGGRLTRRHKWWPSLAAVIIVLAGGALMLMDPSNGIARDAYRRAVAEIHRLTVQEKAETEAVARKATNERPMPEELNRKAADEELAAAAATRRHEEETRQATEEKARAEAAREMAEAQARAEAQEAAKRQAAEDTRLKEEEPPGKAPEGKPRSDAEVREQSERAEADLNLSEQDRKMVQVSLRALGHEVPTATGPFGPRTREMIKAWQVKQGLPATGFLDKPQFVALREQATLANRADETKLHAQHQAEKTEAGLKLSEQDRKRVQVALNALGHPIPTATGYFGPRTRAMITAWQKTQGLPGTGYLTEAQLAILRQQAAAALAKYDQPQPRVNEGSRGTE